MSVRGQPEEPSARRRLQLNVRLGHSEHELLQQLSKSAGLPAAQVVRMLIRQGARRFVAEQEARRREEERWQRHLQREESRWRAPPRA